MRSVRLGECRPSHHRPNHYRETRVGTSLDLLVDIDWQKHRKSDLAVFESRSQDRFPLEDSSILG